MINKRQIMAVSIFFVGLTFIDFWSIFNITLDTKLFGLVQLKLLLFGLSMFSAYNLAFNNRLV